MDAKYTYFLESASELFPRVSAFMEENCMMTSWQHKLKRGSFEGLTDAGLPDIKKTILGVSTNVFLLKPSVKFDTPCMLLF